MIDVIAPDGIFPVSTEAALLERVTACLLKWEKTSAIPLAVSNTGAFLNILPKERVAAGGIADRVVRVEILTPAHALTQEQRAGITTDITAVIAEFAVAAVVSRTWVIFHEAVDGGWGIGGRAYTNADLAAAVRASLQKPTQ